MKRSLIPLVGAAAAGAALLTGCHGGEHAFIVNTTTDGSDAVPGDEVCEMTPGLGDCSLRAAIDETNNHAHPGTLNSVILEPGLGTVTLMVDGTGEDTNQTGDLDILQGVQILGNGNTIDASGLASGDRAFDVHAGAELIFNPAEVTSTAPLALSGAEVVTTVTGGELDEGGAGVLVQGSATIDHVHLTNNHSKVARGGGIRVTGTASIADSTIDGNRARFGGGIAKSGNLTLDVVDTVIDGNEGDLWGGGVEIYSGPATFTTSTISNNTHPGGGGESNAGGGLWNRGATTISGSLIEGNTDGNAGGGVVNQRKLTIEDSTIRDNDGRNAGAIFNSDIVLAAPQLTVRRSTVIGNRSEFTEPGIVSEGTASIVSISDSLIADNSYDAATAGSCGGVCTEGQLTVVGTTVTGNRDSGIEATGGPVSIVASTITDNGRTGVHSPSIAASVVAGHTWKDCQTAGSSGYTLDGDGTCATVASDLTSAIIDLGVLGPNGGPTESRVPFATSPLVDAIPAGTTGVCDGSHPTDQRGLTRPWGGGCDIGAVERQPSD